MIGLRLLPLLIFCCLVAGSALYGQDCCYVQEPQNNEKEEKKEDEEEKERPPRIGNFSLPPSQQPAALFGFGGNIIDKGEIQVFFFADYFSGRKRVVCDMIPAVLFGVTDDWSLLFAAPFTPIMRDRCDRSSGLEDFFVQAEYAFYSNSTTCYVDQATLVANVTIPTGSGRKSPNTGLGAPGLFLGATYYHVMVDWFAFAAPGALLTTSDHCTKYGEQFLYQFGIGRNICSPRGWIYAWLVEVDGQYNRRNRIKGHLDHDSGGNAVYVTPSLWISSETMLLQFGASVPVNQNFFGKQHTFNYALNFNFGWSYY